MVKLIHAMDYLWRGARQGKVRDRIFRIKFCPTGFDAGGRRSIDHIAQDEYLV